MMAAKTRLEAFELVRRELDRKERKKTQRILQVDR